MKNPLTTIMIALVVGALGFYSGIQYQSSKQTSFRPNQTSFGNRDGQSPFAENSPDTTQFGRPVMGEISKVDDTGLTVTDFNGNTTLVIYSDTTTITKSTEGSISDLTVGQTVNVRGQESDGTVTAESISLVEPASIPR